MWVLRQSSAFSSILGVSGLYVASTGSGSDGDWFFSWGLPSLSTLIGAFFSLVTVAVVLLLFEDRRLQTSDTVERDTPPDDSEDWWDPKSRLEWGEVDLVIKNSTAGVIRGGLLLAVAVAIMFIPPFVGFTVLVLLVLVVEFGIAAFMVGQVDHLGEVLFSVQLLVLTFMFLACFLAILFYWLYTIFEGYAPPAGQVCSREQGGRYGNPLRGMEGPRGRSPFGG